MAKRSIRSTESYHFHLKYKRVDEHRYHLDDVAYLPTTTIRLLGVLDLLLASLFRVIVTIRGRCRRCRCGR